jgi:DNA-3-methyladenine glycosylase II
MKTPSTLSSTRSVGEFIDNLLKQSHIYERTITKSGWCLREALLHIASSDTERWYPILSHHGAPSLYHSIPSCRHEDAIQDMKRPLTCFESLCRIVAGQQLAGAAAQAVWNRLLLVTEPTLTPSKVLALNALGLVDNLQKPVGLSMNKARSIVGLAKKFDDGTLSDVFLQGASDDDIRNTLLTVRGIGPWSCDMFLLFHLERPDVMPFGDLGVRKGMAKHFSIRGSGKMGALCHKKDYDKMMDLVRPFQPYRSLFSFYMWRVADANEGDSSAAYSRDKDIQKTSQFVTSDKPKKRLKTSLNN